VANPAAAAGFTYTNTGTYWQLLDLVAFRLVTDGNAANRQVKLVVADGGGVALATLPSASVQTATLTWDYSFSPEFSNFNTVVGLSVTSPLPLIFLQPEFTVAVTIGTVQTGDQISNIRLYAEQFVTGPQGYLLGVVDELMPTYRDRVALAAERS
jgi:hypothetical protein